MLLDTVALVDVVAEPGVAVPVGDGLAVRVGVEIMDRVFVSRTVLVVVNAMLIVGPVAEAEAEKEPTVDEWDKRSSFDDLVTVLG